MISSKLEPIPTDQFRSNGSLNYTEQPPFFLVLSAVLATSAITK